MIKYLYFLCLLLPFYLNQKQSEPVVIKADKFTQLLKNKEGVMQWQAVHSLPAGNFVCHDEPNGNLQINFGEGGDKVWILNELTDQVRAKFEPVINGFKLLGVYSDSNTNNLSINAVYINPKKPNSVLILFEIFPGAVIGVTYYTNEMTNPFEKLNLMTKEGTKIRIDF